jgi:hypothetical protein
VMSNEPRITANFFTNYNELPNLLIIEESPLQIFVHICMHPSVGVIHGLALI